MRASLLALIPALWGVAAAWRVMTDALAGRRLRRASEPGAGEAMPPGPVSWREPPGFARLAPPEKRTSRTALRELGVFSSSAALFLLGRIAIGMTVQPNDPAPPTVADLVVASVVGLAMAFGLPGMFRRCFGHVQVDHRSILVVRPGALPRGFFLGRGGKTADSVEAFKVWAWGDVDRLDVDSMTLAGRRYDVLVVTTRDGRSHPIALGGRVDVDAVFGLAESAGLGSPGKEPVPSRTD